MLIDIFRPYTWSIDRTIEDNKKIILFSFSTVLIRFITLTNNEKLRSKKYILRSKT